MSDNLPPLLQLGRAHYIHLTPKGAFLKVPRYAGFWELVYHTGYITFCHNVDSNNRDEYIGPQEMSVIWSVLCHHYRTYWNDGEKSAEQKVACFETALLVPFDENIVERMRGYWARKKAHFGIREELTDDMEPDQLQQLQEAGLTTDDSSADTDTRPLLVPESASWPDDEQISADDITAEELLLMEAEEKQGALHHATMSKPDPMDMSG